MMMVGPCKTLSKVFLLKLLIDKVENKQASSVHLKRISTALDGLRGAKKFEIYET